MGGRGSKSSLQSSSGNTMSVLNTNQPINQSNQPVQNQVPNAQNTPVVNDSVTAISSLSDQQLADLYNASKKAILPNQLSDVSDQTQRFVFQAGLNEKPLVLDSAQFNQYMQDNNIPQSEILARSVSSIKYQNSVGTNITLSGQQTLDMIKYSRFNYIGGKVGGQVYGAGTYLAMTGGTSTEYGGGSGTATMQAVLNPATAKVISLSNLKTKAISFAQSHPKFASAVGSFNTGRNGNASIYALAMGYNVISDANSVHGSYDDYYNVIDRKALVIKE